MLISIWAAYFRHKRIFAETPSQYEALTCKNLMKTVKTCFVLRSDRLWLNPKNVTNALFLQFDSLC